MSGLPRTEPAVLQAENKKRREEQQKLKEESQKHITGKPIGKQYKNEKSDKYVVQKFDRELKEADQ